MRNRKIDKNKQTLNNEVLNGKINKLSDIICINDENLENAKIEFNTTAGGPGKEPFINRWLQLTKKRRANGDCYGGYCSFYTGINNHNFRKNDLVFSFTRIHDDFYLLTTVGRVKEEKLKKFSKFNIIDKYHDYFGKLIIEKPKKMGQRFTFNLKKIVDKINVVTILDDIYDDKNRNWNSHQMIKGTINKIKKEYETIKTYDKQHEYLNKLSKNELVELAKQSGSDKPLKISIERKQYSTDNRIFKATLICANGICQLCNNPAPFKKKDGSPFLEVHHIVPRSQGGADKFSNCVALCPNCHRKMHIVEDKNDIAKLKEIARKRN